MSDARCDVTGFDQLDVRLEGIANLDPDEIAAALMGGAKILGDEERLLAPKRSGNLAASIVEEMYPSNLPGDGYTVYVGPRTGPGAPNGWYGYLVEMGHEGVPANPFVRPTIERKGEAAMGYVMARLGADILRRAA